jgi:large subunit ribosomal protein L24
VVVVLSGEDAGKTGRVLQVLAKTGHAVVEGLNMVKRHTKKSAKNQQGGIVEKEAPMPLCKLRVSERDDKKPALKKAAGSE